MAPIANCIVMDEYNVQPTQKECDLVARWARESGVISDHMTINIIPCHVQHGKHYTVMATLLLPSIWSGAEVSQLQKGLSRALSIHFNIPLQKIFVTTNVINSGMVVEGGEEKRW